MQSKKLVLLALGGRTTLFYVREINKRYHNKNGAGAVCPMLLQKSNFAKINELLPDQFFQLEEIAKLQLENLTDFSKIVVPNIAFHQSIDRLCARERLTYPIVHPIQSVITQLAADNCQTVKLVSSHYGMNSNYLKSSLAKAGIEVILPSEQDQIIIDDFRKKVYSFSESNVDVDHFLDLLANYQLEHKVLIACTELSLMLPSLGDNLYDMARAQIDEAMTVYAWSL